MVTLSVGSRVLVGQDAATVRYLGEIDGQEGTWAGVEWDNPARGKHDGSTGGKKYFTVVSGHPTGGSFVRANKLDPGISLYDAICKKYKPEGGVASLADETDELYAVTARGDKKAIELVGMEKIMRRQAVLERLGGAYVPDSRVTRVQDGEGQLAGCCPNVETVDVSGNYLADWSVLHEVARALPSLRTLHLSRTVTPRPSLSTPYPALAALETLVLNNATGVDGAYIVTLGRTLPSLKELHVGFNQIASLHKSPGEGSDSVPDSESDSGSGWIALRPDSHVQWAATFPNLQVLNLEGNKLTDWTEVWALRSLPHLRALNLNDNRLSSVSYAIPPPPCTTPSPQEDVDALSARLGALGREGGEAGGSGRAPFEALETFYVGNNALDSWSHVDAVHRMPRVTEARFSGNPVVEKTEWGARYELIARVGKLKVLNGSTVGAMERRDCEVRYVRNCEAERIDRGWTAEQVSALHPRYPELALRFASYLTSVHHGQQQQTTLASEIVSLRLTCVSAERGAVMGQYDRKLPLATKLDKVKMVCERLFKIPAAEILLFIRASPEECPVPESMGTDDSKDLAYFNARDGSEILVDQIAVDDRAEQERRRREAARREQEAREKKQLHDRDSVVQRAKDEDYY